MIINKELLARFGTILSSGKDLDDVLCSEENPEVMFHLSGLGEALLSWYGFKSDASLLEVDAGYGRLTGMLCNKVAKVTSLELNSDACEFLKCRYSDRKNLEIICGGLDAVSDKKFDYITLIGSEIKADLISKAANLLNDSGVLIIGVNNEFSVRRWSGLQEEKGVSINYLKSLLSSTGLSNIKVYYPYPNYIMPLQIFSHDRLPYADEIYNHSQSFDENSIMLHDEAKMSYSLIDNGLYEEYVNSFLIFGSKDSNTDSSLVYTKQNFFRDPLYRLTTSIFKDDGIVVKSPLGDKSSSHVDSMIKNRDLLDNLYNKIRVIPCCACSGSVEFPLVGGDTMLSDLDITNSSVEEIISAVKEAMDVVFDFKLDKVPYEKTEQFVKFFPDCDVDAGEESYPVTNLDSNFDNYLVQGDDIWCIDYEWVVDFPVPVNYVKFRSLLYFYTKHVSILSSKIAEGDFYKAFGIDIRHIDLYKKMDECFQCHVLGENRKYMFISKYEKSIKNYQEIIREEQEKRVLEINKMAADYEAVIAQLRSDIDKQNASIEDLRNALASRNQTIEKLNTVVADRDQTIEKLSRAVKNPVYQIRYLIEESKNNKKTQNGEKS